MQIIRLTVLQFGFLGLIGVLSSGAEGAEAPETILRQFCGDCHGTEDANAGVNFERLLSEDSFVTGFRHWESVARQLELGRMPPAEASQPTREQRRKLANWIQSRLALASTQHDEDPGVVLIRRLTSAEYGHAIEDLTGLKIDVENGFVPDAVGGAGFTNTGLVQFTQESTLERYLESARRVADHAVVGTGPISFFPDPGQTGLELSAIHRILKIYREHGFRTAAGEGGEPFGLDRYTKAFFAAWRFHHRRAAGRHEVTLTDCARDAGIDVRFAEYIYSVVTQPRPSFPTSVIVEAWAKLPSVREGTAAEETSDLLERCGRISQLLLDWQNRFGANTDAKEEAPILRADLFDVKRTQAFEMNVNWPKGTKTAHLVLSVESANRDGQPDAVVLWQDARIQFRDYARVLQDPEPLRNSLKPQTLRKLGFGHHPRGGEVDANAFVTVGTRPPAFEIPIPEGARSARLLVTASLDIEHGDDCIVRCTIRQLEDTDQGKSVSGLLANPNSQAFAKWKSGVLEFARLLPQMSQREPAPSDRDPVPEPIDPSYNNAERNYFHTHMKYFRDDDFLVRNILDDRTRYELDLAWADLLGSFDFHETWLQFLAQKFDLELGGREISEIESTWIADVPESARPYLSALLADFQSTQARFSAAESRHVDDVVAFAARAWRRVLSRREESRLRSFYRSLRADRKLRHRDAICALIARVLVSPEFLYRGERTSAEDAGGGGVSPLTDWQVASRLSFLAWSSVPDEELRRAAAAGELRDSRGLRRQLRRLLADGRSRRFSTEFFGQWFGFYRFHQFRGIDSQRFPEFSMSLRESMHEEAIEFFDFIVRKNRPVNEILNARYSFLNSELAAHYGYDVPLKENTALQRVELGDSVHRGGLLRLGAILATTSAPRRTSPVKRGDWILRRVLGTAVPPPPADAGSISAEEVVAGGLSIRQRLESHRRDASCQNCHSRFDAFGFALENFDPLGRFRAEYRDGTPVETAGVLRDGTTISGDAGLLKYLLSQESRFHDTLARRLLGYTLGRQEHVGDLGLIRELKSDMASGRGLPELLERVVTSPQFRYHRDRVSDPPTDE